MWDTDPRCWWDYTTPMTNYMHQNPEAFEDIYEWEEEGYLADIESADEWEPDDYDYYHDELPDDDFPMSWEYDEGENDMYADGDFFTNHPGDW